MAKIKGDIVINVERCKGCEVCIAACPFSTIAMAQEVNGKGYHYAIKVNNDCTGCMNCAVVCPDGVITVYRAKVAAE
jgi:2-oxoglutarate ferredoxin oxidoreductase subunit delta